MANRKIKNWNELFYWIVMGKKDKAYLGGIEVSERLIKSRYHWSGNKTENGRKRIPENLIKIMGDRQRRAIKKSMNLEKGRSWSKKGRRQLSARPEPKGARVWPLEFSQNVYHVWSFLRMIHFAFGSAFLFLRTRGSIVPLTKLR